MVSLLQFFCLSAVFRPHERSGGVKPKGAVGRQKVACGAKRRSHLLPKLRRRLYASAPEWTIPRPIGNKVASQKKKAAKQSTEVPDCIGRAESERRWSVRTFDPQVRWMLAGHIGGQKYLPDRRDSDFVFRRRDRTAGRRWERREHVDTEPTPALLSDSYRCGARRWRSDQVLPTAAISRRGIV